jgi:hypothetical protein
MTFSEKKERKRSNKKSEIIKGKETIESGSLYLSRQIDEV